MLFTTPNQQCHSTEVISLLISYFDDFSHAVKNPQDALTLLGPLNLTLSYLLGLAGVLLCLRADLWISSNGFLCPSTL